MPQHLGEKCHTLQAGTMGEYLSHFLTYKLEADQGWRQENSERGADASNEWANYFGTRALKPDRS